MRPATRTVEFGLGNLLGLVEVLIGQSWIRDLVTVLGQEGAIHAARLRDPAVQVEDEGQRWSVYRDRPVELSPPPAKPDGDGAYTIGVVTFGGGQLELEIDKCDGRLSKVHLSR